MNMVSYENSSSMMFDLTHYLDNRVIDVFAPHDDRAPLPCDFPPDSWSVICGRGKQAFDHFGNRRLRILCELNLPKYSACGLKIEKSLIVTSIVDVIREGSQDGGFIKKDSTSGTWYKVSDAVAREKVGQQLRELITLKDPVKVEKRKLQRQGNRSKAKAIM